MGPLPAPMGSVVERSAPRRRPKMGTSRRTRGRRRGRRRRAGQSAPSWGACKDGPIQRLEGEMRDLKGKVAVVTGAASGIGRAMAERFARERMRIVLADVEATPLAQAREEIGRGGVEAIAVRTDVSRWEQVEELARRTFEAFGTAHVICNNAGIGAGGASAWETSMADWEWTIGVNLWGVIHGVRAFVPRLVEQGEGHVVNTASIAGLVTVPGMAPYCVTKQGVVALSECLHHDLTIKTAGKVKVSVLCPAWVKTKIS